MWNHKDSYRVRNGIVSASTIGHPSLGLVFFPAFDWKISATHPERQERLLYTRDQIVEEGLLDVPNIREYNPIVADWDVIERVHVGAPDLASWVTDAHRLVVPLQQLMRCYEVKLIEPLLSSDHQGIMRWLWFMAFVDSVPSISKPL